MTPEQKLWACVIGAALHDLRKLVRKIVAMEKAGPRKVGRLPRYSPAYANALDKLIGLEVEFEDLDLACEYLNVDHKILMQKFHTERNKIKSLR